MANKSESKLAVVTGAAGNIGPSICRALKAEGWRVAATGRSVESFRHAEYYLGGIPHDEVFFCDFANVEDSCAMIGEIERKMGPISLLVHNAVYTGKTPLFGDISWETYNNFLTINTSAPFFMTQAAKASLEKTKGSVILISSVLRKTLRPANIVYAMTKAAIEVMTEGLAMELADSGIRVNCIRVGAVGGHAPIRGVLDRLPKEKARELYNLVVPGFIDGFGGEVGARIRGRGEDIAEAVCYLASDKAGFVTGSVFPVDGGFCFRLNAFRVPALLRMCEMTAEWLQQNGYADLISAIKWPPNADPSKYTTSPQPAKPAAPAKTVDESQAID